MDLTLSAHRSSGSTAPSTSRLITLCLGLLIALCGRSISQAQSANFSALYQSSNLSQPAGLVQGRDGIYYGTTTRGGDFEEGSVYQITGDGKITTLHSFQDADGQLPSAPPVEGKDGLLYGTTVYGGAVGAGTIYKLSKTGALTTLHSFNFNDGQGPAAELIQGRDGAFYGTAQSGGAAGFGTIFRITAQGIFTVLHNFDGNTGASPLAGLVESADGFFYGTTRDGASGSGTVFRLARNGDYTLLHSFTGQDGSSPLGTLIFDRSGQVLLGTTFSGGVTGNGTIFQITPAGLFQSVHSFLNEEGIYPEAGLTQGTDGKYYGTASSGSAQGSGTVFSLNAAGQIATLHEFTADEGIEPDSTLVLGSDGFFHSTTQNGGNGSAGTIYQISSNGAFATTYNFQSRIEPGSISTLVRGNDGALYGTSMDGGEFFEGAVIRITTAGVLTVLHSFSFSDGAFPDAPLILGNDGAFYGTATAGGDANSGTIFKVTPDGAFTLLHTFASFEEGFRPAAALVQTPDGAFIGTTSAGGTDAQGTIFKITKSGVFAVLHNLTAEEGGNPSALVAGGDGFYYGTTPYGSISGSGSVFRISESGLFHTIYSFDGFPGANPRAALVRSRDGGFYGTTTNGFGTGYGTVYRITAGGKLTTLLEFNGSNGSGTDAALIEASDNSLYGVSPYGGVSGGSIYRVTKSGVLTTLYEFTPAEGTDEVSSLLQDRDGSFYGSAGDFERDSIYKLVVGDVPLPTYTLSLSGNLAFGGVPEGASKQRVLTITNTGNSPITVNGITYSASFSGPFQGVIPAGQKQNVSVTFTPAATQSYAGKLKVYSNATPSPAVDSLSGQGTTAYRKITLTGDLAFPEVPVGSISQKSLTITNNGNSPLTVSSITYPAGFSGNFAGMIAIGASQIVPVTFAPTEVKSYSGSLTINSNATAGNSTAPVSGTGIAATRIIALGGRIVFGDIAVGTTAQRYLTIANKGNSPLTVQYLQLPDGFYSDYSGVIAPNTSQQVAIQFSPFEIRNYQGALAVVSDPTGGSNQTTVSGTGVEATRIISLLGNLEFGEIVVDSYAVRILTIHNSGNATLQTSYIDLPNGYYADYFGGTIPPNGSVQIKVQFQPNQIGNYYGRLTVNSDATSGNNSLPITGRSVAANHIVSLSGDLAFGAVPIGTTAQRMMTISNTGNSPLTVSSITYPPDFTGNFSGIIAAGQSKTVPVYFTPVRKQASSGVLTVNGDQTSGTNTLPVSGSGS